MSSLAPKLRSIERSKGIMTLSIEVAPSAFDPYLDRAAKEYSQDHPIDGFRPGHASEEAVSRAIGRARLLEYAAEAVVRDSYADVVKAEHLRTVGSPRITVELLSPGNPLVYSAQVSELPSVEMADPSHLSLDSRPVEVSEGEIEKLIKELQKMQTTTIKVERPAGASDRVVLDIAMMKDGVAIDGGSVKGHHVRLSEPYYIPGFTNAVVGMKRGEERIFTLPFPQEHYQKHLAGSNVDFHVTLQEVHEEHPPHLDDAFAQALGQTNLAALKELLRKNLTEEKQRKERNRQEHELLASLVRASRFGPLAEELVAREVGRMLEELEESVRHQGGEFEAHLKSIAKTRDELSLEFTPQAVERVKSAVLLYTIAQDHELEPTSQEIEDALGEARERYRKDPTMVDRIDSPDMRELLRTILANRKAIGWLKEHTQ